MEKTTLKAHTPLPEEKEQYPFRFIEKNRAIKLGEDETCVRIGICEPDNTDLLEMLSKYHRRKEIVFLKVESSDLASYLGARMNDAHLSKDNGNGDLGAGNLRLDSIANDAPVVNLVNGICIEAIRSGASDIHIEAFSANVLVRYRIDGVLHTVERLPLERFAAISTRIKIMANLNIMETRLPQDGRITVRMDDDDVDLRVSIVPIANGESIVLRIFNKNKELLALDELGFDAGCVQDIRRLIRSPHGMILVTGPTGSGKSTTLNAMLREIRDESIKIITIEDPVEYLIEGVDQIQTNERIGLSFESLLRRVLRQDPNVIMIGEIRDTETARLAVRAALTGHLVLSTLHTNDSVSAITRLTDMGIEPFLVSAVIRGIFAQRLIRRLCPACSSRRREPGPGGTGGGLRDISGEDAGGDTSTEAACQRCGSSGYSGRIGVCEYFVVTERFRRIISSPDAEAVLREKLKEQGVPDLEFACRRLVASGITDAAETARALAV